MHVHWCVSQAASALTSARWSAMWNWSPLTARLQAGPRFSFTTVTFAIPSASAAVCFWDHLSAAVSVAWLKHDSPLCSRDGDATECSGSARLVLLLLRRLLGSVASLSFPLSLTFHNHFFLNRFARVCQLNFFPQWISYFFVFCFVNICHLYFLSGFSGLLSSFSSLLHWKLHHFMLFNDVLKSVEFPLKYYVSYVVILIKI